MIVFDTETTGFLEPSLSSPDRQPRIVEIAMANILFADQDLPDKDFYIDRIGNVIVLSTWTMLINPGMSIDPKFSKITGITDAMLAEAPKFVTQLPHIQDFFLGQREMVAHNLSFDRGVLAEELKRIDRLLNFPWPIEHICTVERSQDLHLKDRKLSTLYEHYFGEQLKQNHRAMDDVYTTIKVIDRMHAEGRL
jgi:DNA polymerase III epsilon subunit-like protein